MRQTTLKIGDDVIEVASPSFPQQTLDSALTSHASSPDARGRSSRTKDLRREASDTGDESAQCSSPPGKRGRRFFQVARRPTSPASKLPKVSLPEAEEPRAGGYVEDGIISDLELEGEDYCRAEGSSDFGFDVSRHSEGPSLPFARQPSSYGLTSNKQGTTSAWVLSQSNNSFLYDPNIGPDYPESQKAHGLGGLRLPRGRFRHGRSVSDGVAVRSQLFKPLASRQHRSASQSGPISAFAAGNGAPAIDRMGPTLLSTEGDSLRGQIESGHREDANAAPSEPLTAPPLKGPDVFPKLHLYHSSRLRCTLRREGSSASILDGGSHDQGHDSTSGGDASPLTPFSEIVSSTTAITPSTSVFPEESEVDSDVFQRPTETTFVAPPSTSVVPDPQPSFPMSPVTSGGGRLSGLARYLKKGRTTGAKALSPVEEALLQQSSPAKFEPGSPPSESRTGRQQALWRLAQLYDSTPTAKGGRAAVGKRPSHMDSKTADHVVDARAPAGWQAESSKQSFEPDTVATFSLSIAPRQPVHQPVEIQAATGAPESTQEQSKATQVNALPLQNAEHPDRIGLDTLKDKAVSVDHAAGGKPAGRLRSHSLISSDSAEQQLKSLAPTSTDRTVVDRVRALRGRKTSTTTSGARQRGEGAHASGSSGGGGGGEEASAAAVLRGLLRQGDGSGGSWRQHRRHRSTNVPEHVQLDSLVQQQEPVAATVGRQEVPHSKRAKWRESTLVSLFSGGSAAPNDAEATEQQLGK